MPLVNTDIITAIAALTPGSDVALANRLSVFRGQKMVTWGRQIAAAADPFTPVRNVAVDTRIKLGEDDADFWNGLRTGTMDLADLPEGTTQADLDTLLASVQTVRWHRVQADEETGQLRNADDTGPWNPRQHWLDELASLGFVELQVAEPPPDRWVVTRAQLDALPRGISKTDLINAVFSGYLD